MSSDATRIYVLCPDGESSPVVASWLGSAPAPVSVVLDFDEDWQAPKDAALVVTHCHYEVRDMLLLRRLQHEARVGVLILADGILEHRNSFEHPELPPGALFQPVLGHKIACIGRSQARVLEAWGNVGRCEVVGLPRLDAWIGAGPRRRADGEPFRILVATANVPGFDAAQIETAFRSLADLRAWHARNPALHGAPVELVWRLAGGLDDRLGIPDASRSARSVPLPRALADVDALVTTPSTTQLEAMLRGLPVATLDYTNSPQYVPTAWSITAATHLDVVLPELQAPPAAKRLFQDTVLHDALECRTAAGPRMLELIGKLCQGVAASRERGEPPVFAPRILPDPAMGHHAPEASYDPAALFPDHAAFREDDLPRLRAELAGLRHRAVRESQLEGELRYWRQQAGAWDRLAAKLEKLLATAQRRLPRRRRRSSPPEAERLRAAFREARLVTPACPVCERVAFHRVLRCDRHDLGLETAVCRHCGLFQLSPRPDDAWYERFYARHFWPVYVGARFEGPEDLFEWDQCLPRAEQILDAIRPQLGEISSHLDVGAGMGGMLMAVRNRIAGVRSIGVEPSESGVSFARDRGLDVRHGSFDDEMLAQLDTPFDLVTLVHVLEYALDPIDLLRRVRASLGDSGLAYVEVPDVESGAWSGRDFLHVAHLFAFSEESLVAALARAGLEPVCVRRGNAELWPWGIGMLCRRGPSVLDASAVPPLSRAEIRRRARELRRKVLAPQRWRPPLRALAGRLLGARERA